MPTSFRVLLSCGSSRGRVLLRLLSSLLPGSGFGAGALLRLLRRSGLLPGGGFGGCALLRLLGRGGLLPGGGFGGGALLRLLGRGGLLPGGGFGGDALLRLLGRGGLLPGGGVGGGALLRLLGRGGLLPGGGFGGGALLRLLGRGSLLPGGGFGGRALLPCMVRRHCWRHPRLRRWWCTGDRRRRCRSRSGLRRPMKGLRCRAILLRCYRRRLCRVCGWLRPGPRRWQMGEVGWARRMSCRRRRSRWHRHVRCRHLRRRRPGFSRCRGSRRRRYARFDRHRLPRRLRHPMRPDARRGQMREVRCKRRMAGHGCRRRRIRGRGRCWGCRRRGPASSPGGRLHTSWCRWRFLRALQYGADARRRSEL
jgi:hypothetical protein